MPAVIGRPCGAALFLLLAACTGPHLPPQPHDHLRAVAADGRLVAGVAVARGEGWCLHWNHSVTGAPVADCYVNDGGRMILSHAFQPDFAAGLGHFPGRGELVAAAQGGYHITAINEPVPGNSYILRVGHPAVAHRLVGQRADGTAFDINLSALAAGQRVSLHLVPEDRISP